MLVGGVTFWLIFWIVLEPMFIKVVNYIGYYIYVFLLFQPSISLH